MKLVLVLFTLIYTHYINVWGGGVHVLPEALYFHTNGVN